EGIVLSCGGSEDLNLRKWIVIAPLIRTAPACLQHRDFAGELCGKGVGLNWMKRAADLLPILSGRARPRGESVAQSVIKCSDYIIGQPALDHETHPIRV